MFHREHYSWQRGCKKRANMNVRDFDIGVIQPFDVNSDPSSVDVLLFIYILSGTHYRFLVAN